MNIAFILLLSKKNNINFSIEEAIRGDKIGIDFTKELSNTGNKEAKIKELKNKISLNY